jgi:cathepsin L
MCGNFYSDLYAYFLLRDKAITIADYPAPFTGIAGDCSASYSRSNGPNPRFQFPVLINGYDTGMEAALQNYTFTSTIKVPSHIAQFYAAGVVDAESCATGDKKLFYTVMVVGYSKDSNPKYWKVQWAHGTSYGEAGYMRIVKKNQDSTAGAC